MDGDGHIMQLAALVLLLEGLTCFADPVHVSVHLSFQLLLLLEQKKSGP